MGIGSPRLPEQHVRPAAERPAWLRARRLDTPTSPRVLPQGKHGSPRCRLASLLRSGALDAARPGAPPKEGDHMVRKLIVVAAVCVGVFGSAGTASADVSIGAPVTVGGSGGNTASGSTGTVQAGGGNTATASVGT